INVSSIGGRITFPFGGAYHASKYAVEAMSDALRRELGVFGVDVVLVEPGAIHTEFATRTVEKVQPYVELDSPYRALAEQADSIASRVDAMAAKPIVVSRAIERAIRARRPRARYVAPFSGKILIGLLGRWLPTRLVDAMLRFALRRQLGEGATTAQLSSGTTG
ncbi:MAG: SDR family NAD(P)-dependent oxidoreductase, partial [Polyangiales bacterium]